MSLNEIDLESNPNLNDKYDYPVEFDKNTRVYHIGVKMNGNQANNVYVVAQDDSKFFNDNFKIVAMEILKRIEF